MSPLLILHILGAVTGVLSGAAAMSFRKGSRLHFLAGQTFFGSMLLMSTSAVYLALAKSQMMNAVVGAFTAYLVWTAWLAARRREQRTDYQDRAALCLAIVVSLGAVILGWGAITGEIPSNDDAPAVAFFVFAGITLICAACDARLLMRGGIAGKARVKRHVWRMCTAMFIATASLFLGKQNHFPVVLQGSPIMLVPVFAVPLLMVYWLVRLSFGGVYRRLIEGAVPRRITRVARPRAASAVAG